ncbi:hypothetical protein PCASD_15981 [Puccinia coronata f. sp. avenae]|uniref:Uncharacterized protein n=1 Tax=Puccinia coronata f. sp. avenae TaxID=200324 RepID=A0A2N5TVP6_9BASI|nr:hypothetical protein PCASD_15981 [Puccinia coronata f. sp. avenae]
MHWRHPHPYPHPQRPFQMGTRVPVAGTRGCANVIENHCRVSPGQLVQCQRVGSSAIPTSWYSASSPGGSPDELVLHQLARRAPSKLVLHMLARRAPSKLVLPQLARRALGQLLQCHLAGSSAIPTSWYSARSPGGSPNELVLHQLSRRAPEELVLHQLARRAPGELILHQLPRRALGELALYQLPGSWQAGIFLPACQEATLVSWYGMYQLAKRHSQRAGTLPALQEILPASW